MSVSLTLTGAGSTITINPPSPVVVTALSEIMRGPPGASSASYRTAMVISGHVAVVLDANGDCIPADCTNTAHQVVAGITTNAAIQGGGSTVLTNGTLEHLGWTFTPGAPVFLGTNGSITQSVPPGAAFTKVLGIAISPTRIAIDFQPAIFH